MKPAPRTWAWLLALAIIALAVPCSAEPSQTRFGIPNMRGSLLPVHGHRMYLACKGLGNPTIVFEAGSNSWSFAFYSIIDDAARITRACVYDRAGLGASEAGPMPRSSARVVGDLHDLLREAHIHLPVVLAPHSMGGYYVERYAETYPSDVAGIVFIDGTSHRAGALYPYGIIGTGPSADAEALHCARAADRGLLIGDSSPISKECKENQISILDPGLCHGPGRYVVCRREASNAVRDFVSRQAEQGDVYRTVQSELDTFIAETSGGGAVFRKRKLDIPIHVLTASYHWPPGYGARDISDVFEAGWKLQQQQLLSLSNDSTHVIAASGHWIQLAQPELLLKNIREVVDEVRKRNEPQATKAVERRTGKAR